MDAVRAFADWLFDPRVSRFDVLLWTLAAAPFLVLVGAALGARYGGAR
jgi:hypothetical protein